MAQGDFLEIGSDRGEGSTGALAQMAAATGRGFYSVDFSPIGFARASRACGACAHQVLALPPSGWLTILQLTCWVRGSNPSTLERERAQAHQIGESK